jgi:hypothetical protein
LRATTWYTPAASQLTGGISSSRPASDQGGPLAISHAATARCPARGAAPGATHWIARVTAARSSPSAARSARCQASSLTSAGSIRRPFVALQVQNAQSPSYSSVAIYPSCGLGW